MIKTITEDNVLFLALREHQRRLRDELRENQRKLRRWQLALLCARLRASLHKKLCVLRALCGKNSPSSR